MRRLLPLLACLALTAVLYAVNGALLDQQASIDALEREGTNCALSMDDAQAEADKTQQEVLRLRALLRAQVESLKVTSYELALLEAKLERVRQ